MKRILALFVLIFCFSNAVAENKVYVYPASQTKMLIGETIPAGEYYLLPIDGFSDIQATVLYTLIHDYASKESESDPRDYTQQPSISYPENRDHYITLNDGDLLLLFAFSYSDNRPCDVIFIPKGQDATGGLSGLSYEELIARKNQINLAIWGSKEWQEVTVPQGTWKVGEDIPAGHWTVKCASGGSWAEIEWGEKLQANGEDISYYGRYSLYNKVYDPSRYTNKNEYTYEYSFTVEDGDYIKIDYGSVVFMPYVGKPAFSFK